MRNMQPEAVDDDRRVTMYYKKFRSLNLSALGLGALRLHDTQVSVYHCHLQAG